MKSKIVLTVFCALCSGFLFSKPLSDSEIIDSLKSVLKTAKEGINKVFLLHELGRSAGRLQTAVGNQKAIGYFLEEEHLDEKLNLKKDEIVAYRNIGDIYYSMGDYLMADSNFLLALRISDAINDEYGIASGYLSLGDIDFAQKSYEKALTNYLQALKGMEQLGNPEGIYYANRSIAEVYKVQRKYPEAVKMSLTTLETFRKVPSAGKLDTNSYKKLGDSWAYNNIGEIYELQGKFPEALKYFYAAVKAENGSQKEDDIYSWLHLGKVNIAIGKWKEAKSCLYKALALSVETSSADYTQQCYSALACLYENRHDYKSAYSYEKLYKAVSDSVINAETSEGIAKMQMQFDFDKNLAVQKSEQDKAKAVMAESLKRRSILNWALFISAILLIIIGLLWVNRIKLAEKLQKQAAIAEERRRIGSEMHDDLGSELSKISLLTDMVKLNPDGQNSKAHLENISQSSKEMISKMGELIWALNSRYDNMGNMIAHIRRYAMEYFASTNINCRVTSPENIPDIQVNGDIRKNIFLAVKEALHNVFKHSEAGRVEINIVLNENTFAISVCDNGKGINAENISNPGNGLWNMKKRMENISGGFSVLNHEGTTVNFELPLKCLQGHYPKGV